MKNSKSKLLHKPQGKGGLFVYIFHWIHKLGWDLLNKYQYTCDMATKKRNQSKAKIKVKRVRQ